MIPILGAARNASLHSATISPSAAALWATLPHPGPTFTWDEPSPKLIKAADTIANIHHKHAHTTCPDSTLPGAAQVVFCDRGIPDPTGGPSVYSILTQHLVDREVPRNQIGWVNDWPDPRSRQPLWDQVRTGLIRVHRQHDGQRIGKTV